MNRDALVFMAPYQLALQTESLPPIGPGEMLVATQFSAISAGTELLVYRGQAPADLAVDEGIASLPGTLIYPLKYGYSAVGLVLEVGQGLSPDWVGRRVFSFQPHQSHFWATPEQVQIIPEDISSENAVFLPNMETAVNFLMDGAPLIGERAVVLGQGIVGLLTTALLADFPLEHLAAVDNFPMRRASSLAAGAHICLPSDIDDLLLRVRGRRGADLIYELTGTPAALDLAIHLAAFDSRIIIGSWYGQKRAPVDLGGYFHRSRIRLISSQVSTIAPLHTGRWTKERRFETAWNMIRKINPSQWITQIISIEEAPFVYNFLDSKPEQAMQVIFNYTHEEE